MASSGNEPIRYVFDAPVRRIHIHHATTYVFAHGGADGVVLSKARDESDGTIASVAFPSLALRDLSTQSVTVADVIDSSLHPSMVRALVELYQDPLTNPHGSQLVFTTHGVSLLMQAVNGEDPIGPDQFWIVEKRGGESELYSAAGHGVAEDENVARNHLNGQYGGIQRPRLRKAFAQALEMLEDARDEGDEPDGKREEKRQLFRPLRPRLRSNRRRRLSTG